MKIKILPSYAVLIPSKGRPDILLKTLERQKFLDRETTFIGIEHAEKKAYAFVRTTYRHPQYVFFDNEKASGCVARESLRRAATAQGFKYYIPTDDNARYTQASLENLVRAASVYPKPCIVSGFHGTAPHFDSAKIRRAQEFKGFHFYHKWGAIFWAIPHVVYNQMSYPPDGGRMDDRFVSFAALRLGITEWVVCMEAPFTKPTGQKGGYSAAGRSGMMGQSVVALARDYPEFMQKITISFPWQKIIEKARTDGRSQEE